KGVGKAFTATGAAARPGLAGGGVIGISGVSRHIKALKTLHAPSLDLEGAQPLDLMKEGHLPAFHLRVRIEFADAGVALHGIEGLDDHEARDHLPLDVVVIADGAIEEIDLLVILVALQAAEITRMIEVDRDFRDRWETPKAGSATEGR